MAITEDRAARVRTFDSTSPATGEVVGTFPVDGPEQVAAAAARAREAAGGWAGLGFDGRRRALLAYKALLVRRTDELVALVHRENGKPDADALIEVLMIVEHLDWAARNASRVLGPRRARGNLVLANHAASVEYQPLGVVGVIGPWNYPVFTPLGSIVYALAAGNAVVFKPSELTRRWAASWPTPSPRPCPTSRCSRWSPGTGPPATPCAWPAWTRSRSPGRRPPAAR